MKKFLSIIAGLAISAGAYTFNIQQGWQLEGAVSDMNLSQFKNANIVSVWTYDYKNQKWMAYFPTKIIDLSKYGIESLTNIKKGEGFWVNAAGSFSVNVPDDQKAYEQGYQDGYNRGYQDGLNSSDNTNTSAPPIDNNLSSDNNGGDYNPNNITLIDTPTAFDLSDIAGKTFKIAPGKDGYSILTFDNNGIGHVSFSNDNNYTLKYDNGVIDATNDNNDFNLTFKKLKEDKNGIIVAGMGENGEPFLDAWLNNITPVDMSTLNYPVTFYDAYDNGGITIEGNGTIEYPWGEDENYTIQDGKIVTHYIWNNDDNASSGDEETDTMQIVGQIDRYYVLKHSGQEKDWYISPNLKGKTFDDIIDTNNSVNGLFLNSNGIATIDSNDGEYYDNNETITYSKINSTEINVTECWDSNDCDNYLISIDPDTGKVTREDSYFDSEIVSTSPIVKEDNTSSSSANIADRKVPMNLKRYYELKRQRAKKRVF